MTVRVVLRDLPGDKRAGELALLVEQLHGQGRRMVVWVADEGRRRILDDFLWTFDTRSFVPHGVWDPSQGDSDEAVVLVGEQVNPNRATILLVGDELPPPEWAAAFDEVHDFIPSGGAGEERRRWWDATFGAD